MKRGNGEEGFSLIEVTIAALLTVGLLGAVFGLLNRNQQVFVTESGVVDLNQNMRTVVDLLTRDVQSAGMGLPAPSEGSFAAIFYTNGASGAPDKILIVNGDPYAPTATVNTQASSPTRFTCIVPSGVTVTGTGSSQQITYFNGAAQSTQLYKSFSTSSQSYLIYTSKLARVFTLTQNGQVTGAGSTTQLELTYNTATYSSPATTFGSAIDTGQPAYDSTAKIALLGSLIAYRVNQTTKELERTEDLVNWYVVARGIVDFQVQYKVVTGQDASGNDILTPVAAPTNRSSVRSVFFDIKVETPDLLPTDKAYRFAGQSFEVAPRNFNLLSNTNLSTN